MWTPIIGENAGKVWQALHSAGKLNFAQLRKATELDDRELNRAIGWLAREHKIKVVKDGREYLISVKP
jgi:hypothetical protein